MSNNFIIMRTFKSLLALLFFIVVLTLSGSTTTPAMSQDVHEFVPMKNSKEFQVLDVVRAHDGRRRLLAEPYQRCSPCKCCNDTTCATMPCCFVLDCQIPGKPYGTCSFVQKRSDCTNCG